MRIIKRQYGVALMLSLLTFLPAYTSSLNTLNKKSMQDDQWADSILKTLTLDEKIAQLLWVDVQQNKESINHAKDLIETYKIGGIIFFKNKLNSVANEVQQLQHLSQVPLMTAIDGEWGLGMRIEGAIDFPYAMTLGAIQDTSLFYQLGQEYARSFQELGFYMNLAPVADLNTNPNNPVIGYRSFGESPDRVAPKLVALMRGMQDGGIIATAKHFPGHGDTSLDSHHDLPTVKDDYSTLLAGSLVPFQRLIDGGIAAIMPGHLNVLALDASGKPSSLSYEVVTDLLKETMGFKGLIVSDAMQMKGLTQYSNPKTREIEALNAGHDVLEYVPDVPQAIKNIKEGITQGLITEEAITQKCLKVLHYKSTYLPQGIKQAIYSPQKINTPYAQYLRHLLTEKASTLIKNEEGLIPLSPSLGKGVIVSISPKDDPSSSSCFLRSAQRYNADIDIIRLYDGQTSKQQEKLLDDAQKYDYSILLINGFKNSLGQQNIVVDNREEMDFDGKPFGLSQQTASLIQRTLNSSRVITVHLGVPQVLSYIDNLEQSSAILLQYQDDSVSQDVAAQALYGGSPITGRLPISISSQYPEGSGIDINQTQTLGYSSPESVGLNSNYIEPRVDAIVQEALDSLAFPGCQVLVAKDRRVIFHKAYGYHSSEKLERTTTNDIYDLASVTKIAAPLLPIMQWVDQGRIDLDAPFSDYWKRWRNTNKKHLTLREILTHQARLQPYFSFYKDIEDKDGHLLHRYTRDHFSRRFPIEAGDEVFIKKNYIKRMYKKIGKSDLLPDVKYKYSGLSFLLYPELTKQLTKQAYDDFLYQEFYLPIGAKSLTFSPLVDFEKSQIIPTEDETWFRHQLLHGYVHDEAAAMLGGKSGNAGLFGSANDLAKLMQLYVQYGSYGGKQFISKSTFKLFSSAQFPNNRRGIGFDRPYPGNDTLSIEDSYPAPGVSQESFGHSGYTGTFVWVDPKYNLTYIFLSNRVNPTRNNPMIYRLNIRPRIQQVFYDNIKINRAHAKESH